MAIRIFVTLFGLIVVIGALVVVKGLQFKAMADMGASMVSPPEVISTTVVEQTEWEQTRHTVGTLEAQKGVTITAEFTGRVDEILFTSGAEVQEGDILIQQNIDAEKAQLRSAEASMALAKANLQRSKELLTKRVVSQSQFDASDAEYKAAQAQVENVQVTIDRKSIRAPFTGRLGIRQVNEGEDLSPNQPIVTLQTANPMLVNFSLPQQALAVLDLNLEVRVNSDAIPNYRYMGKITAINPEVNSKSRNVLVQATLNNDNGRLLPGMFASVEVVMPQTRNVTYIPITAIKYATFGDSVFVIEEQKSETGEVSMQAQQQFVQLGEAQGDFIEVLSGVEVGQVVASAGTFKLYSGANVAINNDVAPTYEQSPNPADR